MVRINFADLSTSGLEDHALTAAAGETLINFGDLTTSGDLANGIFAGENDVTIFHFGSIETSGLGAVGIFVEGEDARIVNYGSVHTTGDYFGDFEAFSEGIFVLGDRFYISNHGTVQVDGESSSAMIGIGADGLMINFGVLESAATNSSVIAIDGDESQFINLGQVISNADDVAVVFVAGEDASTLNRGEILVAGDSSNGMQGVVANTHLTNRGVIQNTGDNGAGIFGVGNAHEISNFGLIETHGTSTFGIEARGRGGPLNEPGSDFQINNAGRIATEGDLGIGVALGLSDLGFNRAENGEITNSRVIETEGDGAAGAAMIGSGHHLTNSGRITADGGAFVGGPFDGLHAAAVVVSGDAALVENTRRAVIESKNADSAAVELNVLERAGLPAADMASTLENVGLIKGAAVAVLGGAGEETVINHGRIVGDVVLGDGADTLVFGKGGTVDGDVFLGDGDDDVLIEDGAGTVEVADFAAGVAGGDVIDVSEFFDGFGELQADSHQDGSDVVIELDQNDTLVLKNLQLGALSDSDFLFA